MQVNEKVERKVSDIHSDIHSSVHESISARLVESETRVQNTVQAAAQATLAVASGGGGWKIPFAVLVVLMAIVVFFGYQKYVEMRKSHLL